MKIKFCGMTNYEDVKVAVDLGVDFVGFVFYPKSKRFIGLKKAKNIVGKVKGRVKTVGVFVNEPVGSITQAMAFCGLDYAQVYEDLNMNNIIRVYRIKDSLPQVVADGMILFDVYASDIGGSGETFNWQLLKGLHYLNRIFVAGGVNSDNVGFLKELGVYGVDLVSGVELYPGKKDKEKMKEFVDIVRGWL